MTSQPMSEQEFLEKLKSLYEKFNEEIVNLVHDAQKSHGLDFNTDERLPFADSDKIENYRDYIACLGGWLSDRLNGINRLHKKSLTKKIRKALGYTNP